MNREDGREAEEAEAVAESREERDGRLCGQELISGCRQRMILVKVF